MLKILILTISLLFASSKNECPSKVSDELQLVTLNPQCFRSLYNTQMHDGHKLSRIINDRITNYKRILQDIKMNDVQHLKTHPVIKWAQSQSQIFLNLRLSHRHDSPTCSDIRYEKLTTNVKQTQSDINVTIVESENNQQIQTSSQLNDTEKTTQNLKQPSTLLFVSECFFTHQKLLFSLDMKFNSTLSRMTVKKQGFGRYTIVGDKLENQIWINPFTGWKNAGIWTDMRNKYAKEMDQYFSLLDDSSEKKSSKGKRRRKDKSTQQL